MTRRLGARALLTALLTTLASVLVATVLVPAAPALAAGSPISGAGSTYVGQAMSQWVGDGQRLGLGLNYQSIGSIAGLNFYTQNAQDFAGTEAEFTSIYGTQAVRSYQYVPDVAGATALMYNLKDAAGRKVDYLHLSPHTIAAIFTGNIKDWNDPVIRSENLGIEFQPRPIHVILRSGQSGTTALFYDFVQHAAPDLWEAFRAKNQLASSGARVAEIPETAIPGSTGVGSSDQIAQYIANDASGIGSIGYDEFGYAKYFKVPVAWVQNASGKWVQPYAVNISAALDGATLRPDLSQELSTVYTSKNPLAYPASAYSYIVAPCAPAADRTTCKDPAYNEGQLQTMAAWLDYISCQGQVKMAQLGYSPLPPVLSQEVQRSIQRMAPTAPRARTLSAANCANPRFAGSLGAGSASPPDPFAKIDAGKYNGGGAGGSGTGGNVAAGGTAKPGTKAAETPGGPAVAAGPAGPAVAAGPAVTDSQVDPVTGEALGGSTEFRKSAPVAYRGAPAAPLGVTPGLLLLLLVGLPPALAAAWRRGAARRAHRAAP